jgi:ubiquitin-conjugating enzyme E2 variant
MAQRPTPARAPAQKTKTEKSVAMHLFLTVLGTALQIVVIAALADFVAGVIHWAEDAYFTEDTPIIGRLFIRPNIVHHHHPRFFTHLTWWQSSWDLVLVGAAVLLVAWPLGLLSWQLGLFVALSVNANEIHKWSHRTRKENGRLISALQDWHILQTPRHHGLHHADPKNTYYCPIFNFVNPVLERFAFWSRLEAVIERFTGVTHRPDTAVRGQGPGPAWLAEYRPAPAVNVVAFSAPPNPTRSSTRATPCNCATCSLRQSGTCARHSYQAEPERRAA